MTVPTLTLTDSSTPATSVDVVVVAARSGRDGVSVLSGARRDELAQQLREVGFSGGKDELVRLPGQGDGPSVAVIGLPEDGEDGLRYAAGSAIRQLAGIAAVALDLPAESASQVGAVLEGAALGAYAFTEYREKSRAASKDPVASIEVLGSAGDADADALIGRAIAVAEAASLVKDLVNMPPLDLYPETFAERAAAASADLPVTLTVWDEEKLAADGFGGILGVGQGSTRPPRLVKVSYSPEGAARHLALV